MVELGLLDRDPVFKATKKGVNFYVEFKPVQEECKRIAIQFGFTVEPYLPGNVTLDYAKQLQEIATQIEDISKNMRVY